MHAHHETRFIIFQIYFAEKLQVGGISTFELNNTVACYEYIHLQKKAKRQRQINTGAFEHAECHSTLFINIYVMHACKFVFIAVLIFSIQLIMPKSCLVCSVLIKRVAYSKVLFNALEKVEYNSKIIILLNYETQD